MLTGEGVLEKALVKVKKSIENVEIQEVKQFFDSTPKWKNTYPPRGSELELEKSKYSLLS